MPLYRRVPKKGFTNPFRVEYATVNVGSLEVFENGATVTVEDLKKAGVVKKTLVRVKILGNGDMTKKLTVEAAEVHLKRPRIRSSSRREAEVK